MDKYTRSLLTVIATSMALIAVKMYFPYITQGDFNTGTPTFRDLIAVGQISNAESKKEAYAKLMGRLPLIRVQSGNINAEVTGPVEVTGSVSIDQ